MRTFCMETFGKAFGLLLMMGLLLSALTCSFVSAQGAIPDLNTKGSTLARQQGRSASVNQSSALTFIPIEYPGASATRATGINAQGAIVGSFDDDVATHGFLLRGSRFTTIDVPGSSYTQPKSVNTREEIVGYYYDAELNLHGFYWHNGRFRLIDIPFSIETRAEGINDTGVISGEFNDIDENEHGFLMRDGKFETIDVPNAETTDIWTIANDGWFAGDYSDATTVYAYLRNKHGDYLSLAYPGAQADSARAINDRHEIVGRWDDDSVSPVQIPCTTQCHGFLWAEGVFQSIDVPGAISTLALGINNRRQIVGRFIDSAGNDHGFVTKPVPKDNLGSNQNALTPLDPDERK
jgi:uncharacterized membrane protein